jgi:hypothetical protein
VSAWVKWTAGAGGALVGAAACGIVVIMVWFAVDPAPQYNNWDFATPLLMLAFAVGAAVVGAAAWGFGAVRVAAGEWRALIAMAVVLALSAVLPVVAVASLRGADMWRNYRKAEREKPPATSIPAEGRERERWAAALGRPAPEAGLALARRVQSCAARLPRPQSADSLTTGECLALLLTRADKPRARDLVPRRRWRVAMAVRVGGQQEPGRHLRTARSTTSGKARPYLKCGTPDCSSSASGTAPRASLWIAPTCALWNRIGAVSSTRRPVCVKKGHGMAGGTRSSMRFRATVGAAACVRWRRRDSSTCRSASSSRTNAVMSHQSVCHIVPFPIATVRFEVFRDRNGPISSTAAGTGTSRASFNKPARRLRRPLRAKSISLSRCDGS